jgi:hypothetical protein
MDLKFDSRGKKRVQERRSPVVGQAFVQAVNAFGTHQKRQIIVLADHFPRFTTPRVSILYEKIGCETGVDFYARLYFVFSVSLFLYRQIEVFRFPYNCAVNVIFCISAIDVTAPATFA